MQMLTFFKVRDKTSKEYQNLSKEVGMNLEKMTTKAMYLFKVD